MNIIENDLIFGLKAEEEIINIINNKFNDNIKKCNDKFSKYDFIGTRYFYELKSRRNNYKKYSTTIIAEDKIQNNIIFLFKFIDGLYYIKYRPHIFQAFEKKLFRRTDRGCDLQKNYIYIPIEKLKLIES